MSDDWPSEGWQPGRAQMIPEDPQQSALERIANALESMAKPNSAEELVREHGSMTQSFGELCRIMKGMGESIRRALDQELIMNEMEKAKFLRTISMDLVRYGDNGLRVYSLHEEGQAGFRQALQSAQAQSRGRQEGRGDSGSSRPQEVREETFPGDGSSRATQSSETSKAPLDRGGDGPW